MHAPLPEYPAKTHASYLASLIERTGFVDFDGDKAISYSSLFESGQGRMLAVMTAVDEAGDEVLLKAFSGTFGSVRNLTGWVAHPLAEDKYQHYLKLYDPQIKVLDKKIKTANNPDEKNALINERKALSQKALAHYNEIFCLATIDGSTSSLQEIFGGPVPTGSGECCAPKLFHHAFTHNLRPTSMAEFFVGSSLQGRTHGNFYPPCTERCSPILKAQLGLEILYRDEHLIIVNKESGLLSVPGNGPDMQDSAESRVRRLYPDAPRQCAVHRLDMDTSGIVIVALHRRALSAMHTLFRKRAVARAYEALLEGIVLQEEGVVHLPFRANLSTRPYQIYDEENGKWGTTDYQRIGVEVRPDGSKVTRVHFVPLTGRTHQHRLHASHPKGLGHPILGDRLYGTGLVDRLYLHAKLVSFTHPFTGELLEIASMPPF